MGQTELAAQVQQLGYWSYVLLALLVMIEGPLATLTGAIAASAGLLKPDLVFITAAISNLFTDFLWYLFGYLGGNQWVLRVVRKLGVPESRITQFVEDMNTHAQKILITAKLTLSFSVPALIAAGLARVPWRKAFGVLLPAEVLWTGSLVIGGYYFGHLVVRLEQGIQIIAFAGGGLFVVLLFWYLRRRHIQPDSSPQQ